MTWIIGILLSVVLIALVIGPPGIRKLLFVSASIFGLTVWYFVEKGDQESELLHAALLNEEIAASTRIRPGELHLASVTPVMINSGAYELRGLVTNTSKFVLSGMQFRVSLRNCVNIPSCSVLGERETFVSLAVPPGQTRPFKASPMAFPSLPLLPHRPSVSIELIGTRAEFSASFE